MYEDVMKSREGKFSVRLLPYSLVSMFKQLGVRYF